MDFPAAETPQADPPWRRAAAGVTLLCLAAYALILALNVGAVAGGSDSSGYMNGARLLAAGRVHVAPRTVAGLPASSVAPFLYIPLGFKPAPNGDGMVPTYPSGFALFILAFRPLAGWRHAGDVTVVLHALAGVVATYALARLLGLGRKGSVLCASIIALSPLYLYMSLQAMSDVPSLAWTTLALVAALKSRARPVWALAAGAALAVDVLLRPTNILAFIPTAIALGASPRRWAYLCLGGLPGAAFFCAHSLAAYGRIATTGYGDNTNAFSTAYVPVTLRRYALWLPALFTPLVVLVPAIPWLASRSPSVRWLLGAWIVAFAGFYATYQNTHETWWYLRFLLPAAPAIVVGSALVLREMVSRSKAGAAAARSPRAFAVCLLLAAGYLILWDRSLDALDIGKTELRYGLVADWMKKHVPPDAVCLAMQASGALFYYTDYTFLRWDVINRQNAGRVEAAVRDAKRPLYAVLFPFEVEEKGVLDKRMPGKWTAIGSVDDVTVFRRDTGPSTP